jgi:hypothetical protein
MPEQTVAGDLRNKPVRELTDDVMRQSSQVLETGAQVTAELREIKRRADEALDWRKQVEKHAWVPLAAAVSLAILGYMAFARRS